MSINHIKRYLSTKVGVNILILYYGSRNKKEIYRGVLYRLYNNVFTIRLKNGDIKSFSYSDILTKTIQICI